MAIIVVVVVIAVMTLKTVLAFVIMVIPVAVVMLVTIVTVMQVALSILHCVSYVIRVEVCKLHPGQRNFSMRLRFTGNIVT